MISSLLGLHRDTNFLKPKQTKSELNLLILEFRMHTTTANMYLD